MVDLRTDTPPAHADMAMIATLRANGGTVRDIAAEVGRSKSAVGRAINAPEARAIIERESARLLAALPDITASSIQQVNTARRIHDALAGAIGDDGQLVTLPLPLAPVDKEGNTNPANAIAYAAMAAKRETDILKALGILASPVQSVVIQQIYNDNRQAILSPEILAALSGTIADDECVEDAEIVGGGET